MSSKGIFTALSGAMAQSQRLDTIANNMANSSTTGFKKDEQTFSEYLTANEKTPDVIQAPRIPASIESFYDMQAGDRGYVNSSGSYTDFSQGQLKPTGSPLDLALEGDGLFEVLAPDGIRWTRDGSFKISPEGQLVTKQGFPVLSAGEGDGAGRLINLTGRDVTISKSGDVYASGAQVGRLSVVQVSDQDALMKQGASLYALKQNYNPQIFQAEGVEVHQGYLEGSNVNVVDEMTNMIQASRTFESTQQAIKAFDQIDDKLVNQVGKV